MAHNENKYDDILAKLSVEEIIKEYGPHKSPLVYALVARLETAHAQALSAKNNTNLAYSAGYSAGHAEGYTRGYEAGCKQTANRIHANLYDPEQENERGFY